MVDPVSQSQPVPLFSERCRLDADLHLPSGTSPPGGPPVVVVSSGYQGMKVIHPERFARALTPLGYAVLAFDYRGFGWSEGERSTRSMHDEGSWSRLVQRIGLDRARRASTGRSEITSPWDIVRLDLDERTDG